MSIRRAKAAFCRFLDQAVNNGNLAVIDEIFDGDFTGYFPESAAPARGPAGCRRWVTELRAGFSGLNAFIEGGWLAGEFSTHEAGKGTQLQRVAALVVLRGIHSGPFAGVAATGEAVTWAQVHLVSFVGERIVQDVVVNDGISLLRQMRVASLADTSLPTLIPPELI